MLPISEPCLYVVLTETERYTLSLAICSYRFVTYTLGMAMKISVF